MSTSTVSRFDCWWASIEPCGCDSHRGDVDATSHVREAACGDCS